MKSLLRHIIFVVVMVCIATTAVLAQDIHFSQFYNAPLTQNPALAGSLHEMDGYLSYRNQWAAITEPYKTYSASGSMIMTKSGRKKGRWALGGIVFNDEAGDGALKTTSGAISTVYHVKLSKYEKLGLGIQTGIVSRSINYDNFQWGSQYNGSAYDPNLLVGENLNANAVSYIDLSAGMVYSLNNTANLIKVTSNNFRQGTIGLAFHHLNRPRYSFMGNDERLNIRMVAHANFLWSISNSPFALQPGFNFYKQGPQEEIMMGGMVRYELVPDSKYTGFYKGGGVYAGAYVRLKDAVVLAAMLEYSKYAFGVSYDINTSSLKTASGGKGGVEFTLRVVSRNPYFKKTQIF